MPMIDIFQLSWQAFPQHEQLQQQYADKVHPERYNSPLKDSSVRNVVADPDVPRGFDVNSSEYDLDNRQFLSYLLLLLYMTLRIMF